MDDLILTNVYYKSMNFYINVRHSKDNVNNEKVRVEYQGGHWSWWYVLTHPRKTLITYLYVPCDRRPNSCSGPPLIMRAQDRERKLELARGSPKAPIIYLIDNETWTKISSFCAPKSVSTPGSPTLPCVGLCPTMPAYTNSQKQQIAQFVYLTQTKDAIAAKVRLWFVLSASFFPKTDHLQMGQLLREGKYIILTFSHPNSVSQRTWMETGRSNRCVRIILFICLPTFLSENRQPLCWLNNWCFCDPSTCALTLWWHFGYSPDLYGQDDSVRGNRANKIAVVVKYHTDTMCR
jgi:hypothetical protein